MPCQYGSNGVSSNGTLMNVGNQIWDPKAGGRPSIKLFPQYSSGAAMASLLSGEPLPESPPSKQRSKCKSPSPARSHAQEYAEKADSSRRSQDLETFSMSPRFSPAEDVSNPWAEQKIQTPSGRKASSCRAVQDRDVSKPRPKTLLPKTVMCPSCKKHFGPTSIEVHMPQCKAKKEACDARLPTPARRRERTLSQQPASKEQASPNISMPKSKRRVEGTPVKQRASQGKLNGTYLDALRMKTQNGCRLRSHSDSQSEHPAQEQGKFSPNRIMPGALLPESRTSSGSPLPSLTTPTSANSRKRACSAPRQGRSNDQPCRPWTSPGRPSTLKSDNSDEGERQPQDTCRRPRVQSVVDSPMSLRRRQHRDYLRDMQCLDDDERTTSEDSQKCPDVGLDSRHLHNSRAGSIDWDGNEEDLVPCPNCHRTFLPARLEVHSRGCRTHSPAKPSGRSACKPHCQSLPALRKNAWENTIQWQNRLEELAACIDMHDVDL